MLAEPDADGPVPGTAWEPTPSAAAPTSTAARAAARPIGSLLATWMSRLLRVVDVPRTVRTLDAGGTAASSALNRWRSRRSKSSIASSPDHRLEAIARPRQPTRYRASRNPQRLRNLFLRVAVECRQQKGGPDGGFQLRDRLPQVGIGGHCPAGVGFVQLEKAPPAPPAQFVDGEPGTDRRKPSPDVVVRTDRPPRHCPDERFLSEVLSLKWIADHEGQSTMEPGHRRGKRGLQVAGLVGRQLSRNSCCFHHHSVNVQVRVSVAGKRSGLADANRDGNGRCYRPRRQWGCAAGTGAGSSPRRYASMFEAAFLPSPIARMTVAAPRTMSPPAKTPSIEVCRLSSISM